MPIGKSAINVENIGLSGWKVGAFTQLCGEPSAVDLKPERPQREKDYKISDSLSVTTTLVSFLHYLITKPVKVEIFTIGTFHNQKG
jgi:hypothetical protein